MNLFDAALPRSALMYSTLNDFFLERMEFKLKFYSPQLAPMAAILSLLMIIHGFAFFAIQEKNSSIAHENSIIHT